MIVGTIHKHEYKELNGMAVGKITSACGRMKNNLRSKKKNTGVGKLMVRVISLRDHVSLAIVKVIGLSNLEIRSGVLRIVQN